MSLIYAPSPNCRHAILLSVAILALGAFGLSPGPASAATKPKSKTSAVSKTKTKKPKPNKAANKDEAELKKANDILKSLSRSKKSSLTKLLKSGKKEALIDLPGVGKVTADAIIKARPLKSTAHLILVRGIGEKRFKQIVDSRK